MVTVTKEKSKVVCEKLIKLSVIFPTLAKFSVISISCNGGGAGN
jgi:hypothetical protein